MNDLVSVVVTCGNHDEPFIEQCLQSISNQTYQTIELLIINAGSIDQSNEKINELLSKVSLEQVQYRHQADEGICIARNQGLEWATGKFILFLSGNHLLDCDYIEKLVRLAQKEHTDIVYTEGEHQPTPPYSKMTARSYLGMDMCALIRREKIGSQQFNTELTSRLWSTYEFFLRLILEQQARPTKCMQTKATTCTVDCYEVSEILEITEKKQYATYLASIGNYIEKIPQSMMVAVTQQLFSLFDQQMNLAVDVEEDFPTQKIRVKEQFDNQTVVQDDTQQLTTELTQERLTRKQVAEENRYLNDLVAVLTEEKQQILQSNSYRVGRKIIQPLYYGRQLLKNPKLLKKIIERARRYSQKFPRPQRLAFRLIRKKQRMKNNYDTPKRVLIFVIYEEQSRLQQYKYYFLKELAVFVEKILIVVNGSLAKEDIEKLKQVGQVEARENTGYDTAAFRYGIQFLGQEVLSTYDELLLVNDTNVGPLGDFSETFKRMAQKKVDFWGISYGEEQNDSTSYNKYGYIPIHLQSYFLAIEKSLLTYKGFYDYWLHLEDTDSREKAIGKHETVFTKHFEEVGFTHAAVTEVNMDSPMYIHPLKMVKTGVPLVKYSAFANNTDEAFVWQGLTRTTEVPQLIEYIKEQTDYPLTNIEQIMLDVEKKKKDTHILLIDGVEYAIPQLTTYRVHNKKEQLESLGYQVNVRNVSSVQMKDAEHAHTIIIYRAPISSQLIELVHLARMYHKTVLFDIDDLVIDTHYTDQLSYVTNLSENEKKAYDSGVINYGAMMMRCDGIVTSTKKMQEELLKYKECVLLNRNLANRELVALSAEELKKDTPSGDKVKIGYFSGSITHNENFSLIKPALIQLFDSYDFLELHIVGHLDLPPEMKKYRERIKTHSFVPWKQLPKLINQVDINLAPLVGSIFNEAKSEIKWIEASLVKVPTVASNLGAFKEMIHDEETGILANDNEWFEKLEQLILSQEYRKYLGEKAYDYVINNAVTDDHKDELTKNLELTF